MLVVHGRGRLEPREAVETRYCLQAMNRDCGFDEPKGICPARGKGLGEQGLGWLVFADHHLAAGEQLELGDFRVLRSVLGERGALTLDVLENGLIAKAYKRRADLGNIP